MSKTIWVLLLSFAFISTFIPYVLLSISTKYVDISRTGVLLLLEPISAILLGYTILHETITVAQVLGGIVVVSSVIAVSYKG